MKVLIVSTIVPFIEGGGTFIVDWLSDILKRWGHKTDVLKIPFYSFYPVMFEQMLALRLLDVGTDADIMIAIRTPSYLIKHPNKVLWFIHHHRPVYDLFGTQYQDVPNNEYGLRIRQGIIDADNAAFAEAKHIFTNSKVVADRLKRYNNVGAEVLYPPINNPERFFCKEYGDFIFYPSRVCNHKRQLLAVEAMKFVKSGVKLIVAGCPENDEYTQNIKKTINKYDLESRVKWIDRWISEEEKIGIFSSALCSAYLPFDEDSYGYSSLEAFHSKKPVVTCTDSGGTLELVENGVNGYICEPDPNAIAEAFDRLYTNKQNAKIMGETGLQMVYQKGITCDNLVKRIFG